MNNKEYQAFIEELSYMKIQRIDTEPLDLCLINDWDRAIDAIEYRKSQISTRDMDIWGGLLSIGIFKQFDEARRLACICMCIEASIMRNRRKIQESCDKYHEDMPLFKECPDLYECRDVET